MADPIDSSATIEDISRFKMDHADYVGMTSQEKRRAIVRLLRQCNFCVTSLEINKSRVDEIRAGVTSPRDFEKYKMQAHESGIAWVRCNENLGYIADGMPVAFDPVTGEEVTGTGYRHPDDPSLFPGDLKIRKYHTDEFYVLGYALCDPIEIKNADDEVDHKEVAVQFVKKDPILDYAYCVAVGGTSITERSPPASGDFNDIDTEMLSSTLWTILPARDGVPSWQEMYVYTYVWTYDEDLAAYIYAKNQIAPNGRVLNRYPYGFRGDSFIVIAEGDHFIIHRPYATGSSPYSAFVALGEAVYSDSPSGGESTLTPSAEPIVFSSLSGTLYIVDETPNTHRLRPTSSRQRIFHNATDPASFHVSTDSIAVLAGTVSFNFGDSTAEEVLRKILFKKNGLYHPSPTDWSDYDSLYSAAAQYAPPIVFIDASYVHFTNVFGQQTGTALSNGNQRAMLSGHTLMAMTWRLRALESWVYEFIKATCTANGLTLPPAYSGAPAGTGISGNMLDWWKDIPSTSGPGFGASVNPYFGTYDRFVEVLLPVFQPFVLSFSALVDISKPITFSLINSGPSISGLEELTSPELAHAKWTYSIDGTVTLLSAS